MKKSTSLLIFAFTASSAFTMVSAPAMADKPDNKCQVTVGYEDNFFHLEENAENIEKAPANIIATACEQACLHLSGNAQKKCTNKCKKSAKVIKKYCPSEMDSNPLKAEVNEFLGDVQPGVKCTAHLLYDNVVYDASGSFTTDKDPKEELLRRGCRQTCSARNKAKVDNTPVKECQNKCLSSGQISSISCEETEIIQMDIDSTLTCSGNISFDGQSKSYVFKIPDRWRSTEEAFTIQACDVLCDPYPRDQERACENYCKYTAKISNLKCKSDNPKMSKKYAALRAKNSKERTCSANVFYKGKSYPVKQVLTIRPNSDQAQKLINGELVEEVCDNLCDQFNYSDEMRCENECRKSAVANDVNCADK